MKFILDISAVIRYNERKNRGKERGDLVKNPYIEMKSVTVRELAQRLGHEKFAKMLAEMMENQDIIAGAEEAYKTGDWEALDTAIDDYMLSQDWLWGRDGVMYDVYELLGLDELLYRTICADKLSL